MTRTAIVVGGGPAGASAALALRTAGFEVSLLEQRDHWTGRVCGAFLSPEATAALSALRVLGAIRDAGAVSVSRAILTAPGGRSVEVPVDRLGPEAMALPRQVLEETLLVLARHAGVSVEMGTHGTSARPDGSGWEVEIRGPKSGFESRRAALVVLADGRFTIGAGIESKPARGWFGWNATFRNVARAPGELSLHFLTGGYVGVMPFADGTTNVCGLAWFPRGVHQPWSRIWETMLDRSKPLRDALYGAEQAEDWRGVGPLPHTWRMRSGHGAILAGDAAGVGDPFMGEGIGRALSTGPLLAGCLAEAGTAGLDAVVGAYDRAWNRRYGRRRLIGRIVRELIRNPVVAPAALRAMLGSPGLLRRVLPAIHGPA